MPDATLVMTFIGQVLQMPVLWIAGAVGALFVVLLILIRSLDTLNVSVEDFKL